LNGLPQLFDQLIVNLKEREEHGVIPPKQAVERGLS